MDVYLAARDLNGVPVGRHQFFIIVTGSEPKSFSLRHSGERITSRSFSGTYAIVLGAQNVPPAKQKEAAEFPRLILIPFEKSDTSAAREFLTGTPSNLAGQLGYRSPEVKKIEPSDGKTDLQLVEAILAAADHYIVNERNFNIAYPPPWLGKNSNSWTNSILDVVPAKLPEERAERIEFGNFRGADAAHDVRIQRHYFTEICNPCKIQNPVHR